MQKFTEFRKENFPKASFRSQDLKVAAKYYAIDKDKAIAFLKECLEKFGPEPPNFKPPAKCFVVDQSRPFDQFDIVKASRAIQSHIYNSTKEQVETWSSGKNERFKKSLKRKEEHVIWLAEAGLSLDYQYVQAMNMIFSNALSIYNGVEVRLKNRNAKLREKNPVHVDLSAFDENGYLIQKPGINPNIYCIQGFKTKPIKPEDEKPSLFENYNYSPSDPIPILKNVDRLKIPKGEPGYIPPHHRSSLNLNKRVRRYFKSSEDKLQHALLVRIDIKGSDDWVICDVRGLVRNARYRKLIDNTSSLNDVMELFTGDPVIDTSTGEVTFSYVEGVVPVRSIKSVSGKRTKKVIDSYLDNSQTVGVVSIDLGVINPYTYGIYIVDKPDSLIPITSGVTIQKHKEIFKKIKSDTDVFEESIVQEAISKLSPEEQEQISSLNQDTADSVKNRIILQLGYLDVDWDNMSEHTYFISDFLITQSRDDLAYFTTKDKNGNEKSVKKKDIKWFNEFRVKLNKETRDKFNELIWGLKRASPMFKRLSKRKLEESRRIVNNLLKFGKDSTGCDKIILAIENLDINNKDFSGRGFREVGWHNFINRKKENRWFIQPLKKAILEQSANHGINVLEVNKNWTSKTCPKCDYCSKDNRPFKDDRETFICKQCNYDGHADIVATYNIAKVAVTGIKLPGPPKSERSGARKKCRTSRKTKSSNISKT